MNRKIITSVSVAVIAAILLLWAVMRLTPIGQSQPHLSDAVQALLILFALPMRLYVVFVIGENGHWSLPALVLLLAASGLMWGVIVERIVWMFSRRKTAH
jgi:hypothetical protein